MIRFALIPILFTSMVSSLTSTARPTGTLTQGMLCPSNCISGWTCYDVTVQSPDVIETSAQQQAILAVRRTSVTPVKGMVFAIGGSSGGDWWDNNKPLARSFESQMIAAGYDFVQMRYQGGGWPHTAPGAKNGFLRLACRPATAVKWAHDNWLRGGRFMLIGSSEGSAACAYSMAMYGIKSIVNRVVYISGPPMTDLVDACLSNDPNVALLNPGETGLVDEPDSYIPTGPGGSGPCTYGLNSPQESVWWQHNSADTADDTILPGGVTVGDYSYPNTRVMFIIGSRDSARIHFHAQKLIDRFALVGQATTVTWVPTMGHSIQDDQNGLNVLYNYLTQP